MKLAVAGSSGYLGSFFLREALAHSAFDQLTLLSRRTHPLQELREHGKCSEHLIDFEKWNSAEGFPDLDTDALLYMTAISSPVECEKNPELAWQINHRVFADLKSLFNASGRPVYYVSTDLVFEGAVAPPGGFLESSNAQPFSVYGESKLASESLFTSPRDGAVLRSSLIYGEPLPNLSGNLAWMTAALKNKQPLKLFIDEWRTPVYVQDVVRALICAITEQKSGVFHLAGPNRLSRFEFGERYARALGVHEPEIIKSFRSDMDISPPRAEDVSLSIQQTQKVLGIEFLDVEHGLYSSISNSGAIS